MRLLSLLILLAVSCASATGPYLFPRAKQKHEVVVYGEDGKLKAQSVNYLMVEDDEARITSLSPASFTAMKAIAKRSGTSELIYLHPTLQEQEKIVQALLQRLSKLLWARQSSSDVIVLKRFADGSAEELEWMLAKQRIFIRVVKL